MAIQHQIAQVEGYDEILSIIHQYIGYDPSRSMDLDATSKRWRSVRRWLWRLWRFEPLDTQRAAMFLATTQPRAIGPYRPGPRYETLFRWEGFLRALYGRACQELRPNNYISRHFGNSWMTVQKILRRPPGGKGDPMIERWQYQSIHIERHGKTLEHLTVSLAIERLARMVSLNMSVAVISEGGIAPLIAGEAEPNNALLERYKKLTDPAPFRKALPAGMQWI